MDICQKRGGFHNIITFETTNRTLFSRCFADQWYLTDLPFGGVEPKRLHDTKSRQTWWFALFLWTMKGEIDRRFDVLFLHRW
jgi:hypothetical protein